MTNADGAHHHALSIGATDGTAVARLGESTLDDSGVLRLRTVTLLSTFARAGVLNGFAGHA